ncbi:DNA binding methylated-DNA-cysteine S-methyltransferase [Trametes versicolor FP-101664 SS1]|uniref:DNA binding methylated-DNA-cysteine S-methyltransferase n=1 Tax=Trametes versicolor (strain FP-101664) TaxID=717944 RepID=UPI000462297C|nr:DNA binding methylated-DNA-cysteine S-methyltransferase [Trametes versicolor FP-101664 SS1]EIW52206.1 DNA binding methylated-DNA-cysteine S-methyltransferase [Trametes versicolor FP-101664 SS1]
MDGDAFHAAVYHVVRQIPPQKVTSYGHIAKLVGMPNYSRHVGQALRFLSPDVVPPIPWYRVISSAGTISSRGPGTDGAARQRDALVAEGVDVEVTRSGDMKVNMRQYGWFPAVGTIDTGVQQAPGEDDEGDEQAENGDEEEAA